MKLSYKQVLDLPRFLMIWNKEGTEVSKVEALEVFTFNGVVVELNLRLRSGPTPDNEQLVEQLRTIYKIPLDKVGFVYPLAGDCFVQFTSPDIVCGQQAYWEPPRHSDTFGFCNGRVA